MSTVGAELEHERLDLTAQSRRVDAVRALARAFCAAGLADAAVDARHLVAGALDVDAAGLLATGEARLASAEALRISSFAHRRLAREPVARILGRRWFHGALFEIGSATLDPRSDTETLVDGVLARLGAGAELHSAGTTSDLPPSAGLRLLDLGTGSGAILVALLRALPGATGRGVDVDPAAIAIAARNAARLGVADRATFTVGCWLDDLGAERFDVIVSNPPYIATAEISGLAPEVACYDPFPALDGGNDGLDAYRAILARVGNHLAPGGLLAFEIGVGQETAVADAMARNGLGRVDVWRDLAGHARCVAARAQSGHDAKKYLDPEANRASL
jgi:release factor glutamine methyltransferase